ncbi:MAG: hypothetical protein ACOYYS_04820 [Chloroflexota bacterium]
MKKLLTLIVFGILLAPAPWGIAIHAEMQQCAGYWAGDEYFTYTLPDGWQAYYPDEHGLIHTPAGMCRWERDDWAQRAETCCKELGYAYFDGNLGERRLGGLTLLMLAGLCLAGGVILFLLAGAGVLLGLCVYFLRR